MKNKPLTDHMWRQVYNLLSHDLDDPIFAHNIPIWGKLNLNIDNHAYNLYMELGEKNDFYAY